MSALLGCAAPYNLARVRLTWGEEEPCQPLHTREPGFLRSLLVGNRRAVPLIMGQLLPYLNSCRHV
jgi:hypothetical protein